MQMKTMFAALAGLSMLGAPALAQNVNANNLISVQLNDALIEDVANDLDVNVSQIPVSVQVPVGVAAAVCGVDANVLARGRNGDQPATCDAGNTSTAFNQAVQRQLLEQ